MRVVVGRVALDHGRELARRRAGSGRCGSRRGPSASRIEVLSGSRRFAFSSGTAACAQWLLGEQRRGRAGRARRRRRAGSGRSVVLCSSAPSLTRRAVPATAQLLHEVEHRGRDLLLGAARHVAARRPRPTIVTSFWSESKPMSGREMSFTTIASSALALELVAGALDALRRRARRRSRRSIWPSRRWPPASASTSAVATSSTVEGARAPPWRSCASLGLRRPEVGDRGGHQQHVARREALERRVAQLLGGLARPRIRRRACAAARRSRRPRSRRRRGAPPPRRARSPCARSSGCRRSAPSRAARACRRR